MPTYARGVTYREKLGLWLGAWNDRHVTFPGLGKKPPTRWSVLNKASIWLLGG